ncbi:hypothetical protein ETB97_004904 [Aspergillus alliaceus]|uniref:Fungal-specific transcription factor domain-containing protein n=1 Tax=Petromyces alliaceus TaxID=209559 RepID=A0A8H6E3E9_PETAA|nr:hypothetical protein ETB97_004904 [Aspergillus burnettii]
MVKEEQKPGAGAFRFVNPRPRKKRRPNPFWANQYNTKQHGVPGRHSPGATEDSYASRPSNAMNRGILSPENENSPTETRDCVYQEQHRRSSITPVDIGMSAPCDSSAELPDHLIDTLDTETLWDIMDVRMSDNWHNHHDLSTSHLALPSPMPSGPSCLDETLALEDHDTYGRTGLHEKLSPDNSSNRLSLPPVPDTFPGTGAIEQCPNPSQRTTHSLFNLGPWPRKSSPLAFSMQPKSPDVSVQTLIDRYNRQFCALPITSDFPYNPFRCQTRGLDTSTGLLHAFLAIAYYHIDRESPHVEYSAEMNFHKGAARKLCETELKDKTLLRPISSFSNLINTIAVLFTFEAAQSAIGRWSHHLTCIHDILEHSGGASALSRSPKLQTQVIICLWWDVTVAMTSREAPVFPYSYFNELLSLEEESLWTFFDMTGCPRGLLVALVQLAHMAAERERVLDMRFACFNLKLVDDIEDSIYNWSPSSHEEPLDWKDEEEMHLEQDRIHCFEAWRFALLLYIQRVFRWNRKTAPWGRIKFLARKVVDHIQSCRLSSFVSKQVLMPVFLAGAELQNQDCRDTMLRYCHEWHKKSGYKPFGDTRSLLEEIWKEQEESDSQLVWWGSVIDAKHKNFESCKRYKLG